MCHPPENSRGKPLWCLLVTCLGKRRRGTWGESPGSESYSEVGGWVPPATRGSREDPWGQNGGVGGFLGTGQCQRWGTRPPEHSKKGVLEL